MGLSSRAGKPVQDCFPRPDERANVHSRMLSTFQAAACLAMVAAMTIAGAGPSLASDRLVLHVGALTLEAEVAETAALRRRGLAGRAAGTGDVAMLFVFPRAERPCFWMRNTLVPLSLAFIDARGVIRQLEALVPNDERRICARQPIRWALEVSADGPAAEQLAVGRHVHGLPKPVVTRPWPPPR